MAAVLDEFQFDLDDYVFGHGMPIFVDEEGFDPGDPDKITQDGVNPITGARMFGRDMQSAASWTWACHVNREDVETALESAEAMGSKWRDERWHEDIAPLRYKIGGRTRVVFGRPRRFSFKPGNRLLGGYLPPMASFDLVDAKTYDDVEQYIDLGLVPPTPGGFVTPITFPLTIDIETTSLQPGLMDVGGSAKTSVIVEFHGPVTNPSVDIGGIVIGLTGTIGADSSVTVDTSPWSQGVTRVGSTAGVALSRDTRIARSLVGPGQYEATLRGTDATGTARCRVRWRNAHNTL